MTQRPPRRWKMKMPHIRHLHHQGHHDANRKSIRSQRKILITENAAYLMTKITMSLAVMISHLFVNFSKKRTRNLRCILINRIREREEEVTGVLVTEGEVVALLMALRLRGGGVNPI
jgi:hypothetical protein